jgi:hypothetical protein
MVLDHAMPVWWRHEVHTIDLPNPRRSVIQAAHDLTWGEAPFFHGLLTVMGLGLRRLPGDARVLAMFESGGYTIIHQSDDELVAAGLLRLSAHQSPPDLGADPLAGFRDLVDPGVKVGLNFLYCDGRLRTETRVQPTTRAASRWFRPYWWGVRAGGGLIRRSWLNGVRQRSERLPES